MLAVIFEVTPFEAGRERYFELAAALKAELETVDGFISVERFESLMTPGKFLSLSFWRDEEALAHWRQSLRHRAAQSQGRSALFDDYRLRVASVIRDYGLNEREEAPADLKAAHPG